MSTTNPAPTVELTISVDEAARRLSISRRTYYRLADLGSLPRPLKVPGCRRSLVNVTDLELSVNRLRHGARLG